VLLGDRARVVLRAVWEGGLLWRAELVGAVELRLLVT
jgi:hypothetical protein